MIATKNINGQIVLPSEATVAAHAEDVQEFSVKISNSGIIRLSPKRKHRMSLLEHLRGMRGLEIERRREPISR
jgi:antitoxin component of MazEF toxin-antitoxin module